MTNSIGYKRPPRKTRFKKGQSGNPKGRPKKDMRLAELLRAELNEQIEIEANGKTKKITKQEALLKRLTHMALGGEPSAMKQVFSLIQSKTGEQSEFAPAIFQMLNRPPRDVK